MRFSSLISKMTLNDQRRGALCFENGSHPALTQTTFESLLYTIRDADFQPYEEHELMSDGREAWDPLWPVRRITDELQAHWQDIYKPVFSMVIDESMIGWIRAINVHMTVLPNKPTNKGVCSKTLYDARTCVMLAVVFVESAAQQAMKCFAGEGKFAAVCLRLTAPWHNLRPQQVIADAWFYGDRLSRRSPPVPRRS
jgi:hypothetical protein